ncbi:apolipoprotein D isoform X2 [Megachile rotundata]|uniref:apolipoprotein D isoform X2 n=1 Tax=Megachile rotundata TaxID=143995 RepID=UPI003FCFCD8F
MGTMKCLIFLAGCFVFAKAHTYHMGGCPIVEPMQGFQMSRFLGVWYVIQKTSTASKCITYNYTRGEEPGEYVITQDSDHPMLGVAGSASHVVFLTDYDNYAGIFTCQKLAFAHRQSATILSRHRELSKVYVDQIRERLSSFGVDPFDLSIVPQTGCSRNNDTFDINVNPNTFTSESLGNVVRKAGEKLGDGVQWVANTGSKVYHKLAGDEQNTTKPEDKAGVGTYKEVDTNEVGWIP